MKKLFLGLVKRMVIKLTDLEYGLYKECRRIVSEIYSLPIIIYVGFIIGTVACFFLIANIEVLFILLLFQFLALLNNIRYLVTALRNFEYSYCEKPEEKGSYYLRIVEPYNKDAEIMVIVNREDLGG